jgi:hypothetical protein
VWLDSAVVVINRHELSVVWHTGDVNVRTNAASKRGTRTGIGPSRSRRLNDERAEQAAGHRIDLLVVPVVRDAVPGLVGAVVEEVRSLRVGRPGVGDRLARLDDGVFVEADGHPVGVVDLVGDAGRVDRGRPLLEVVPFGVLAEAVDELDLDGVALRRAKHQRLDHRGVDSFRAGRDAFGFADRFEVLFDDVHRALGVGRPEAVVRDLDVDRVNGEPTRRRLRIRLPTFRLEFEVDPRPIVGEDAALGHLPLEFESVSRSRLEVAAVAVASVPVEFRAVGQRLQHLTERAVSDHLVAVVRTRRVSQGRADVIHPLLALVAASAQLERDRVIKNVRPELEGTGLSRREPSKVEFRRPRSVVFVRVVLGHERAIDHWANALGAGFVRIHSRTELDRGPGSVTHLCRRPDRSDTDRSGPDRKSYVRREDIR